MKLNFPNILVLVRLAFVPIIILLLLFPTWGTDQVYANDHLVFNWTDALAGVLFILASITDYVDGWYARKYDQISTFGKLFDPLADKILVNSVLIIFSARGIVPIIFTVLFIVRDILVDGLRMMLASNNIVLAADKWGKLKTVFQMIGLSLIFFVTPNIPTDSLGYDWTNLPGTIMLIPLTLGLAFSVYSGFNYYIKGFSKLN